MRSGIGMVALLVCAGAVAAQDEKDRRIQELQRRVEILEQRLARLENARSTTGPAEQGDALMAPRAQIDAQRTKARQRMAEDRRKYNVDQLAEAEELYQKGNSALGTPQGKAALTRLIEKFPDIDRTGCAVLYLGQKSRGEEKVKYLTMAYEKFADCYYGNGVQVGPYARFLLGVYHREMNKPELAEKQLSEILRSSPDAVDHGGRSLKKVIETLPPTTQPAL
jgi:hypothetical protein